MEFQTWSYKRGPGGELPPGDDKFEDRRNDAMDCIKGFVATNPTFDPVQTHVEVGEPHHHDYSGGRIRRHRMITLRDGRQVRLLEEDDEDQEE
jgi:hypothetical protein